MTALKMWEMKFSWFNVVVTPRTEVERKVLL